MKPKIIVSKFAGYCMGVKRAFSETYKVFNFNKNVCIYGEMVHNKYALNLLYEKGIKFKKDLNEIIKDKNIDFIGEICRICKIIKSKQMYPFSTSKTNDKIGKLLLCNFCIF